jgi:putative membrane protein
MKVFWGLGRLLTLLFCCVVLANQLVPFVHPLLLLIHVLEVLLCNRSLKGRPHPWRDRGRILLFGVFHLQTIPAPAAPEASSHA